ncbi:DUF1127 domain-containing protein [Bradyrhizobium sp. B097]|uniref:DUF1127 domain-containing protein n=1 Tax=Bradyrhizobium sp. B097 TaxID=3140244 RepID=UPI0031839997
MVRFRRPRFARRVRCLVAGLAAALAWIGQWRENRRAWRQLAAMSERELQDIGICRADVVDHGRYDKGRPYWPP